MDNKKNNYIKLSITGVKYLFSVFLVILATNRKSREYLILSLIELCLIAMVSNAIVIKNRYLGNVINNIAMFFLNAQMAVLYFGNTYLSSVMLSNLNFIEDLGGNAKGYITGALLVFVFSFLPICGVGVKSFRNNILIVLMTGGLIGIEVVFGTIVGIEGSPYYGYVSLAHEEYDNVKLKRLINDSSDLSGGIFYSEEVGDYRAKDSQLPENPNVILIMTEGLSQSVIDDERAIMPNVAAFQQMSLNFNGYYNHTFATLRGIIGQLYSGYQLNNLDENHLISIQQILGDYGYHTAFINTEPNNTDFVNYLDSMEFDELLGESLPDLEGVSNSYSDRQAYELLYDTVTEFSEGKEPFFVAIYTFATHVSHTSPDEVFGDGSNNELNKFYNLDVQFGKFLKKFEESTLADNTIIIFTTDHATYQDNEFTDAFPDCVRISSSLDQIPLCIYYTGITPETIEVGGRNSLDLAPTILDYLDISAPNYFLGESLFSDFTEELNYDTIFYMGGSPFCSMGEVITSLSNGDLNWFKENVKTYFASTQQSISYDYLKDVETLTMGTNFETFFSDDGNELEIIYSPEDNSSYNYYSFAVWSDDGGQDDLVWYTPDQYDDGTIRLIVTLEKHCLHGVLNVHVYAGMTETKDFLDKLSLIIP